MDRLPSTYQPYYSYPFTDSLYLAQPSRPVGYPATFGYPYASSDLGRSYYINNATTIRPMLTPSRIVTSNNDLFNTDFIDESDDNKRRFANVNNRYIRNIRPVPFFERPRAPILAPSLTLAPMSERITDLDVSDDVPVVTPKPVKPKEPKEGVLRDPRTVTSELCTIS